MLRFDLKALAARNRKRVAGRTILIKPILGTRGAELSYLAALNKMVDGIFREVANSVLPIAMAEIKSNIRLGNQPGTVGRDAAAVSDIRHDDFRNLRSAAAKLAQTAEATVSRVLKLESGRHTKAWAKSVRNAFGIDLSAVLRQEDISEYLEAATTRSAGLIEGLADDAVKRVQQTVSGHLIEGGSQKALTDKLSKQLKVSKNRARLIARDQTSKFNSDLNRIRHEQAGVTRYVWRTSRDERVRDLHARLEGHEYTYGESTGAEGGDPPGQPINCRCVAQPIVRFK